MPDTRLSYDKDQVRERTDLLALVGQYVALKKRGGRYVGLCPFHQEKSPSFGVDPQKGFWHCFGCGKGGDAFNFLMEIEHLDFGEALERLAERAGIHPIMQLDAPKRKEERDFLFEVNAATAAAFRKALQGSTGAKARAYLENRGITAEHAARFGLGYAPAQWDALTKHLTERGFSSDVLTKADLARSNERGLYDRFRNRLMIPIHDRQGRVVAFGGRALSSEDQPKYLNTGDTPVFSKGRLLYALHLAIDGMKKRERAIVTEGYFDAIACHLAGFTETVATLGTALSDDHVRELRRFAEKIYLVFDADSAGINAALRGQAMFRAAGTEVRIVRLPSGHDPDTLIREQGAEAFEACLANALAPTAFELERLVAQHPAKDTESRLRLFRAAAAVLQPLPRLERAAYAEWLVDRWLGGTHGDTAMFQQAILSEVMMLDRRAARRPAPVQHAPEPAENEPQDIPEPPPAEVPLERAVLAAMVQHPEFAGSALQALPAEAITHPRYRRIFTALNELAAQGMVPDARSIVTEDDTVASTLAALALHEVAEQEGTLSGLLDRLREEYERRVLQPPADPLADPAAARAWAEKLRARSQRIKERGGYEG
ncbi:MAG: DNA primase [Armatimonadota bacterium]